MAWLSAFVGSGTAINWILGLVVAEALAFVAYRSYTHSGLRVGPILSILLPGACLLLALRCALTNTGGLPIAAFLLAAFVTHIVDVTVRWRESARHRFWSR